MDENVRAVKSAKKNDSVKLAAEVLIVIILAIIIAGVINAACFDTTRVSGPSMDDTLYGGGDASISQSTFFDRAFFGVPDEYGDKVLLAKTHKADRGDIIVFHPRSEPDKQYIKRVIAVAGDEIAVHDGNVYLNGLLLDESGYVTGKTYVYSGGLATPFAQSWVVPEGCYFVMGDNRQNSSDSRVSNVGFVEASSIVGRVILVLKKDTKKIVLVKNL